MSDQVLEAEDTLSEEQIAANKRKEFCKGLESLAQFLRSRPSTPLPTDKNFLVYLWGKNSTREAVKAMGTCDKEFNEYQVTFSKSFGPIKYGVFVSRDTVCRAVVVGKKTISAKDAVFIPSEPAKEVDDIKWECEPLLAEDENSQENSTES
jgi:lipid II:glycine glycyltransferase (peptidoglycan interpeptide bridge formation enzyme)